MPLYRQFDKYKAAASRLSQLDLTHWAQPDSV